MKFITLLLFCVAVLLYSRPFWESLFCDVSDSVGSYQEIFPSSIQEIQPIEDIHTYLSTQTSKVNRSHQTMVENIENVSSVTRETLESAPDTVTQKLAQDAQASEVGLCLKIGPILEQQLSVFNRALEKEKLLEKVSIETVLDDDQWIVFIVPSSSKKGASALAAQIKKQGYKNATVIDEGPLLNAVRLGIFQDDKQAETFYEQALVKTKIQGLRMTRMIGQPTNRFLLVFSGLTKEEGAVVQLLAKRHNQKLSQCF